MTASTPPHDPRFESGKPEWGTGSIPRDEEREICGPYGQHHFFMRDHVLGIFPVGKPYCTWCGKTAA